MPLRLLLRWFAVVLATSGVCLSTARGDTFNWIGLGNTPNWDDHSGLYENWGTIALPAPTSDVTFGNFLSSGNPNLHGNRTVNSVTVSTAGSFTLTGGVSDVLNLASGNFTQVAGGAASGTHQVNVPLVIQKDGIWDIEGGGVTFAAGVTSSFGGSDHMLTKTGAGPLTLGGGASGLSLLAVRAGNFILNGGALDLTGMGDSLVGDGTGAASLLVENGATLRMLGLNGTDISGTASNPAVMTVTGATTKWQSQTVASIGLAGPGQLLVKDLATASADTLYIGNGHSGALTVQGGGTISDDFVIVGAAPSAAATVTVAGAGSQWTTSGEVNIGGSVIQAGSGTLSVSNQALTTAGTLNVFTGGSVTVDAGQISTAKLNSFGSGGTINLVEDLLAPALTVNGTSGNSNFGGVISGAGTLYKSGGSSLTLTNVNTLTGKTVIAGGQVVLGNSEALQSSVVDFETKNGLNVNGLLAVFLGSIAGSGDEDFGSSTIDLDGSASDQTYSGNMTGLGTLTKYGVKRLILSGTKNFMAYTEVDQGTLEVSGKLQGVGVTVNSSGKLAGTGQVAANVLVNSGGVVAPGTGAGSSIGEGVISVQSAYFESGSEFDITLHGTTRGAQYGALVASNDVILGGTLKVSILGLMPAVGQSFDFLDWGTVTGSFSGFILPTLSPNLMWNKSKLYTDGVISVGIAGDYTGNGVVDAADYILWRKTLSATDTSLAADGNSNGMIDAGDFDIWRSNFGRQAGGTGTELVASVPEPLAGSLLSAGLLLFLCGTYRIGGSRWRSTS